MDVVSVLKDVQCFETRSGSARDVARDADGREYTTFREEIGRHASGLDGGRRERVGGDRGTRIP
ncbi:MAG: hypothetical protein ACJ780_20020 [Solirubrobacteraceae bacterium]